MRARVTIYIIITGMPNEIFTIDLGVGRICDVGKCSAQDDRALGIGEDMKVSMGWHV